MIFIERLRELLLGLMPRRSARSSDQESLLSSTDSETNPRVNPWTQDLERLACYTKTEPVDTGRSDSGEVKIQLLMEQARLVKAKEVLKQQQQQQQQNAKISDPAELQKPNEKRKTRTTDATIVDGKAWWGQAVATWDPEDAKNLGPQGEIRHPRQHKWFNQ